ncbi:MAG: hypothetical protein ACOCV1_03535 [Bacillota bacterium]
MYKIEEKNGYNLIHIEKSGLKISLLDYGASIYQLQTPDISNNYEDIVLQYKNFNDYLNNDIYLNATIGPVAGRIQHGIVKTKNQDYHLDKNFINKHTLHSGKLALSFKKFDFKIIENNLSTEVIFTYQTNQEINFIVKVTYKIFNYKIKIIYEITTENEFIFNLTNHAYFNLSGNLKRDIKNHIVQINTTKRHLLNDELISTNKIVEEPLYDFTNPKPIKDSLNKLKNTKKGGFDDIYFFPYHNKDNPMAIVYEPISKRQLKVYSSYDHMVFYTHNNPDNKPLIHINKHPMHQALCFECEKKPYGFNNNNASDLLLKPGNKYQEYIIFKFGLYNE